MIIQSHQAVISTPSGNMQTSIYRPVRAGAYPSIIFYSEIFQETAPITRSAKLLAGHGFVVLVPEVFHELNPAGTVLAYDDKGKDKGNADKFAKPLEQHDSDPKHDQLYRFTDLLQWKSGLYGRVYWGPPCIQGSVEPKSRRRFLFIPYRHSLQHLTLCPWQ